MREVQPELDGNQLQTLTPALAVSTQWLVTMSCGTSSPRCPASAVKPVYCSTSGASPLRASACSAATYAAGSSGCCRHGAGCALAGLYAAQPGPVVTRAGRRSGRSPQGQLGHRSDQPQVRPLQGSHEGLAGDGRVVIHDVDAPPGQLGTRRVQEAVRPGHASHVAQKSNAVPLPAAG
jgi:hypothetical protein